MGKKCKGELKSMKKYLALALALLMVCVMLPVTALADGEYAELNGTKYATLKEAVEAAPADGTLATINVLGSHTGQGIRVEAGQNIVINFNGYTYTLVPSGAGSYGTKTAGFQLIMGSTVKMIGGTVNIDPSNLTAVNDDTYTPGGRYCNIMRLIQSYADVTLTDMHFSAENLFGGDVAKDYVMSFNKGKVLINGSTSIEAFEGFVAFDSCDGSWAPNGVYNTDPLTAITIDTTGTITGNIEMSGGNLTIDNANVIGGVKLYGDNTAYGANVIVNGGTYTDAESVRPYLPEGKTLNANGTVVDEATVRVPESGETTTPAGNPSTGAAENTGIAAAMVVIALLGTAAALRK